MISPGMNPGGPLGGGWTKVGSWKASSAGTAQSRGSMLLDGMLGGLLEGMLLEGGGAGSRSPGVKGLAVAESLLSVAGVWALRFVPVTGGVVTLGKAAAAEEVAAAGGVAASGGVAVMVEVAATAGGVAATVEVAAAAGGVAATAEGVAAMVDFATGGVDTFFRASALGWREAFGSHDGAFLAFPCFLL